MKNGSSGWRWGVGGLMVLVLWPLIDLPRQQAKLRASRDFLARLEMVVPLKKQERKLPTLSDATALIQQVPAMMQQYRLGRTGIGYALDPMESGYQRLRIKVPLTGSYENIRRFLYAVETHPSMLMIEQLGLRKLGDQISAEVSISTYVRSEK